MRQPFCCGVYYNIEAIQPRRWGHHRRRRAPASISSSSTVMAAAVLRKRTQQPQPLFSSLFKQPLQQFSLTQDQQEEVQLEEATIQWVLCRRRRRLVGGIYTIYYALSLGRKAFLDLDILLLFGTIFAEGKKTEKVVLDGQERSFWNFWGRMMIYWKVSFGCLAFDIFVFPMLCEKKNYVELVFEIWFYIRLMTTTSWNKMHTPPVMYYHFNVKLFCINDDIMFFWKWIICKEIV